MCQASTLQTELHSLAMGILAFFFFFAIILKQMSNSLTTRYLIHLELSGVSSDFILLPFFREVTQLSLVCHNSEWDLLGGHLAYPGVKMLSQKLPMLFRIDQVPQVRAFIPCLSSRVCRGPASAMWEFRILFRGPFSLRLSSNPPVEIRTPSPHPCMRLAKGSPLMQHLCCIQKQSPQRDLRFGPARGSSSSCWVGEGWVGTVAPQSRPGSSHPSMALQSVLSPPYFPQLSLIRDNLFSKSQSFCTTISISKFVSGKPN